MYCTLDQIKNELDQLRDTTDHDSLLLEKIERATAFVNNSIGTRASLTIAAIGTAVVYGNGLQTLLLPVSVAGSVTLVTAPSGYTVPDYIETDGALVITDSTGIVVSPYRYGLAYSYGSSSVWSYGVPYTVSATFGVSAGDLALLTEASLQIAVQLWRYKDAGGSETIGSEGAVTTVRAGFTPLVKQGLEEIRRRLNSSVGVW